MFQNVMLWSFIIYVIPKFGPFHSISNHFWDKCRFMFFQIGFYKYGGHFELKRKYYSTRRGVSKKNLKINMFFFIIAVIPTPYEWQLTFYHIIYKCSKFDFSWPLKSEMNSHTRSPGKSDWLQTDIWRPAKFEGSDLKFRPSITILLWYWETVISKRAILNNLYKLTKYILCKSHESN